MAGSGEPASGVDVHGLPQGAATGWMFAAATGWRLTPPLVVRSTIDESGLPPYAQFNWRPSIALVEEHSAIFIRGFRLGQVAANICPTLPGDGGAPVADAADAPGRIRLGSAEPEGGWPVSRDTWVAAIVATAYATLGYEARPRAGDLEVRDSVFVDGVLDGARSRLRPSLVRWPVRPPGTGRDARDWPEVPRMGLVRRLAPWPARLAGHEVVPAVQSAAPNGTLSRAGDRVLDRGPQVRPEPRPRPPCENCGQPGTTRLMGTFCSTACEEAYYAVPRSSGDLEVVGPRERSRSPRETIPETASGDRSGA